MTRLWGFINAWAASGPTRLPLFLPRWNDMGNITHNKSTILVELINKEETVLFHTVSRTHEGRVRPAACPLAFSTRSVLPCSRYLERINKYSIEPKLPALAQCCHCALQDNGSDFTFKTPAFQAEVGLSGWGSSPCLLCDGSHCLSGRPRSSALE